MYIHMYLWKTDTTHGIVSAAIAFLRVWSCTHWDKQWVPIDFSCAPFKNSTTVTHLFQISRCIIQHRHKRQFKSKGGEEIKTQTCNLFSGNTLWWRTWSPIFCHSWKLLGKPQHVLSLASQLSCKTDLFWNMLLQKQQRNTELWFGILHME